MNDFKKENVRKAGAKDALYVDKDTSLKKVKSQCFPTSVSFFPFIGCTENFLNK